MKKKLLCKSKTRNISRLQLKRLIWERNVLVLEQPKVLFLCVKKFFLRPVFFRLFYQQKYFCLESKTSRFISLLVQYFCGSMLRGWD